MQWQSHIARGKWWRFGSYRVQNNVIRPVDGTALEAYDPWQSYGDSVSGKGPVRDARQKRMVEPPYRTLLDLVDHVGSAGGQWLEEPNKEVAKLVEDWCSQFGLLGILPHCAQTVVLAARWQAFPVGGGFLMPAAAHYVRTATGWEGVSSGPFKSLDKTYQEEHQIKEGDLIAAEALEELRGFPRPGVILRPSLGKSNLESQPLSKSWARYFPQVHEWEAETYQYPIPLSRQFWEIYTEPMKNFLGFAFEFHQAVKTLSSLGKRSLEQLGQSERTPVHLASQSLNGGAQPNRTFRQRGWRWWPSTAVGSGFSAVVFRADGPVGSDRGQDSCLLERIVRKSFRYRGLAGDLLFAEV